MTTEKQNLHRLTWVCLKSGRTFKAGVAFYNELDGDYRLCVDALCNDKFYFLKPVSVDEGGTKYRLEALPKYESGKRKRREIGVGHGPKEVFPIQIEIGPCDRILQLEAA